MISALFFSGVSNRNLLLNAGPTADGRILPIFEERLSQMGAWLVVNGEAIYGSVPWRVQNDTADGNTWYTTSKVRRGEEVAVTKVILNLMYGLHL